MNIKFIRKHNKRTNEHTLSEFNHRISNLTSRYDIEKYREEVWNILFDAYSSIGGLLTVPSSISLFNKTDELSFCKNVYGDLSAAAVYSTKRGGKKLIAIGSDGTPEGRQHARKIIQRDINEQFIGWYWVEASGSIEYLEKKYNGYPIPSMYAAKILDLKDEDVIIVDEAYYKRQLGPEGKREWHQKIIFGFKDKDTFDKIITEYFDYYDFREQVNKIGLLESYEWPSEYPLDVYKVLRIINLVLDTCYDMDVTEMPREMYDELEKSVKFLERQNLRNSQINSCIRQGNYMLNTYTILELHQFVYEPLI